jgi:hypothetical protein
VATGVCSLLGLLLTVRIARASSQSRGPGAVAGQSMRPRR